VVAAAAEVHLDLEPEPPGQRCSSPQPFAVAAEACIHREG
jgi:hypothetical protein